MQMARTSLDFIAIGHRSISDLQDSSKRASETSMTKRVYVPPEFHFNYIRRLTAKARVDLKPRDWML